jgi:hypothetical protein
MNLIKTILICLISGQLFGTAQIPDFLIYQDDTLAIYSNPLEGYFDKKGERTIGEIDFEKGFHCTALWRGYVGTWQIENDSLFLVNLETDYCSDNPTEIDLTKEFNSNRIFANWVSFEILNPFGKQIKYVHQGYESIYEYERGFEFVEGNLITINNYDNSKSRESVYTKETEILHKFLYENINWKLVESQKISDNKRVIARFRIGENEKPTGIEIMRGVNPKIDKEAERIIKLIPEWDVYYRRGKVVETQWTLPIFFDKEFYEKKIKKENGG